MNDLTDHGLSLRDALSQRYGVSQDAVLCLMNAVSRGGGNQAQFSHPELGGMGQWSSGGMTMVGDMFNNNLKALVANLCGEIANGYYRGTFYLPPPAPTGGTFQGQQQGGPSMSFGNGFGNGNWWPSELGQPASSGSQNNLSYAIFPGARRLAVNLNGQVTVYDTGEHRIGGVSQQQSGGADWTFTSQFGTVQVSQLPVVSGQGAAPQQPAMQQQPAPPQEPVWQQPAPEPAPEPAAEPAPQPAAEAAPGAPAPQGSVSSDEVFAALEKLGALRDMGILNETEFSTKKAELLARL